MNNYFRTVLIGLLTLSISMTAHADEIKQDTTEQQQQQQKAKDTSQQTYKDIEKTFGFVPKFLEQYPSASIDGAWAQMKSMEMNNNTALDAKSKELIGLAVAAQIPCTYCIEMHTKIAKSLGASDQEVKEAVAMAAATRHWSTVLNGLDIDEAQFSKDVDMIIKNMEKSKKLGE
ncbi:MAG: carboxymuconolactone decarboxylase family protein [Bacteriovoracaceae bacterium]|nr:carboxymuconolactone decarboxylase family protein [Bacteriovoracaceae bacterium]